MCSTYKRREILTVSFDGGRYSVTPNIGVQNALGFRLKKVLATAASNNISSVNNTIVVNGGAGDVSLSLTIGEHDPFTLAADFDVQVAASALGLTCVTTYSVVTHRFTHTFSGAVIIKWSLSNAHRAFGQLPIDSASSITQISARPLELIPPYWLLVSNALGTGRKSTGGGGGTRITSPDIQGSPVQVVTTIPNQVDGSMSTFAYIAREEDGESYQYNAPRQISEIDLQLVHPIFFSEGQTPWWDNNSTITYEIEFTCQSRFK